MWRPKGGANCSPRSFLPRRWVNKALPWYARGVTGMLLYRSLERVQLPQPFKPHSKGGFRRGQERRTWRRA